MFVALVTCVIQFMASQNGNDVTNQKNTHDCLIKFDNRLTATSVHSQWRIAKFGHYGAYKPENNIHVQLLYPNFVQLMH
jgi:hypothetical protein